MITNYDLERLLPREKNKKVIGSMKDELGGKIMTGFAALRPKTLNYLTEDNHENKKPKGTKLSVIKRKLNSEEHKHCLETTQFENEINQVEKNEVDVDSLRVNHKKS